MEAGVPECEPGCVGMWRLESASVDGDGSRVTYRCELCGRVWTVPPGGIYPPES